MPNFVKILLLVIAFYISSQYPISAQQPEYRGTEQARNSLGYTLLQSWKRVEFSLTFNSTLSLPLAGIIAENNPREILVQQPFLVWGGGWQCRLGKLIAFQEFQRGVAQIGVAENDSARNISGGILGFGVGYVVAESNNFSLSPMFNFGILALRFAGEENNAYAQFSCGIQASYCMDILERPVAQLPDVLSMPFVLFSCSIGYAHLFAGNDFTSRNGVAQARLNIGIGFRTEYVGEEKE